MTDRIKSVLLNESGTSLVEFSLFVGLVFLASAGFLLFSATQLKEAFMNPNLR